MASAFPIDYPVNHGEACLMPVRGFPLTVGDDRLRYVDHGDREGNTASAMI